MRRFWIIIYILFLFFVFASEGMTQTRSEINLAREYLRKKEYAKAEKLYEKLYSQQPSSGVFFRYYIQSLVGMKAYQKATRIAKRHIRRHKEDLRAKVELGRIYQHQGDDDEAKDVYEDVIEQVEGNFNRMRSLANIFISKRLFGWAEQVYLTGAKRSNNYRFNYELANVYYYQRNYPKMIDAYLELLAVNDKYLNTVKNRLNSAVYTDTDDTLTDVLKRRLLLKSQEYSGRDVFNELLIWAYLHDKEFKSALMQAKALDRRNNENGSRILKIARKALSDNQYNVVADAASFVMQKGKNQPYYLSARELYLKAQFKQVERGIIYEESALNDLADAYRDAIESVRPSAEIIPFYVDLTRLYAFYKHSPDSALIYLKQAQNIRHISALERAKIDILEADVKLSKGQIFDATLIYAAVERDVKNNPVGYKAKLRKSTMAFYQCDFEWALGQLNILKASTSKLIANDAADLSLVISENKSEDSLQQPLCIYAKARMAMRQNKMHEALAKLDSLIDGYPGQPIVDDALMSKAKIMKNTGKYELAVNTYLQVASQFSYEPYAGAAVFFAAQLYHEQLNNAQKAFDLYKKVLTDYPMSIYLPVARENLRAIRKNSRNIP